MNRPPPPRKGCLSPRPTPPTPKLSSAWCETSARSWLHRSGERECKSVRLEVHRIVPPLIRPQAADAHHPVVSLADVGQPLPADVGGVLAPFAVAVLVYDQD